MKTKTIIIIVAIVVVVLILVVLAVWAYRKGKKSTTIAKPPLDIPEGGNNSYGVSAGEILAISQALYEDMDGYNAFGHDIAPYQKFAALSDTDTVKVYNTFNTDYQDEGDGTLYEWIDSESFLFDDVIESILAKMERLHLK
jgi:hypothetical protein